MVNIIHSGENTDKLNDIIDAAQKRFGMFGLEKTTMKEIAADLGLSKGSLYYYFPDKEQLYKVVIEKEQAVFIKKVKDVIRKQDDPVKMIREYVRIRLQYFRKLLNLSRFRLENSAVIKPIFTDLREKFMLSQVKILENIFQIGIDKGVFQIEDTKETAILFIDLFICLGKDIISKKLIFYLEKDEYDLVVIKVNRFTELFIRGIMKTNINN
jgi:AcrR family transcriptional regulator